MGASDYMVGNAPSGASYAAPLLGFQLGQSIAQLPSQFMQGREDARKIRMEDAFPNGFDEPGLRNPDNTPNINAILDRGAKLGGMPFVQGMIPFLNDAALGRQANEGMRLSQRGDPPGYAATQSPQPRVASPNGAGPGNIVTRPPQAQPAAMGGEGGEEGPTINTIVAEYDGGGRAVAPPALFFLVREPRSN